MSEQAILRHLENLVGFDTQNPPRSLSADSALIQYLTDGLSDRFAINVWDHGDGHVSFYALRGQPTVLFNVHLDTVPNGEGWNSDPQTMQILDDSVYGRGACDIKGAAACLLALAESGPEHLALLFTTDEEGAGSCCVRNFLEAGHGEPFSQVVVAEPTECKAVLGHRGFLSLKARFSSKPGHSSEVRGLEDNAIHQFSHWSAAALELARSRKQHEDDPATCLNIGLANGGTNSNVIAGSMFAHASARLQPGESNEQFVQELKACASSASQVEWEVPFQGEPLPASGRTSASARAFAEQCDLPVTKDVDFWTEASIFSEFGLSALVLGPGSIQQAHIANEWVSCEQLNLAMLLYQKIIHQDAQRIEQAFMRQKTSQQGSDRHE